MDRSTFTNAIFYSNCLRTITQIVVFKPFLSVFMKELLQQTMERKKIVPNKSLDNHFLKKKKKKGFSTGTKT